MSSYLLFGFVFMMVLDTVAYQKGIQMIGFWGRFFVVCIWPIALLIFIKSMLE